MKAFLMLNSSPTTFLAALMFAALAVAQATNASQATQPNVLLIITDDQGYGDFSIHGNTHLQTPNIDKLGARYDAWFADISRQGLERFPLPVGHAEHNPVELHAPQAFFTQPLQFAVGVGSGAANDWLTAWKDAQGKVWFDIEVATAGDYDIELALACPPSDAGSRVRISVGSESFETVIPAAVAREIPLPHRNANAQYRSREWATLKAGTLKLPKGPAKLTLEPLTMPGAQVMDLKQVKLLVRSVK